MASEAAAPELLAGYTEELPSLPFVNQYRNGKYYYVRKCYEEYYQLVKEKLLDPQEKYVTVTGTPGIGKSVFYAYFFQRFRKETDDTSIIAISYIKDRLAEAAVFEDDGKSEELVFPSTIESRIDEASKRALDNGKKVLFLCDGPPDRVRPAGKMVVFTSPNENWLKAMRKDNCIFYMPLWTCEELQEAAFALGLAESSEGDSITDEVVEARFNTFGGVARECFLPTKLLAMKQRELIVQVKQISDPGELENLIDGTPIRVTCHRVLHYVPDESKLWANAQLASPFVVESVAQRMLKVANRDREKLRISLEGIPQGASLLGWIFETGAHEGLQRGCTLKARLLQDQDTTGNPSNSDAQVLQTFRIAESPQPDMFKLKDLSPAVVTRGPYHKPESKQFESIDGFYLSKLNPLTTETTAQDIVGWNATNTLILFQMTISKTHPVNASGIISVLKKLHLLEAVKSNPSRAALVFVVPQAIEVIYKRQDIIPEATDDGPVLSVKGIGPQTGTMLAKLGIHSISQLKAAVNANTVPAKMIRPQAVTSLSGMRDKSYSEAMAKIPQYVCSFSRIDLAHSD